MFAKVLSIKKIFSLLLGSVLIFNLSCRVSTARFQSSPSRDAVIVDTKPVVVINQEVERDSLGYVTYDASPRDVSGSTDHHLIQRYPGSLIMAYQPPHQGNMILPLGLITNGQFFESKTISGNVTSLLYKGPEASKVKQIFETYESKLEELGFTIVFKCQGNSCQDYTGRDLFAQTLYRDTSQPNLKLPVNSGLRHTQRFMSAEKVNASSRTYLTLMVKEGWWESPAFRLDIAEN
ncbi:MAG: DUF4892 domain-containing protein [Cyclobacteriaceae bacterium]